MTYASALTVAEEVRHASTLGVSSVSFWMFAVVFWGNQYQRFCWKAICKTFLPGFEHINLEYKFKVLTTTPQRFGGHGGEQMGRAQIVYIAATIMSAVLVVNFVIDVPHKFVLHATSGAFLHLQKLMHFLKMRLAPKYIVCLLQCFSLPFFYLDFSWLVSQHSRFPFPFTSAVAPLVFCFLGFGYISFIYALVYRPYWFGISTFH